MKVLIKFLLIACAMALVPLVSSSKVDKFTTIQRNFTLPYAVSDMSTTLISETTVLVAGGCIGDLRRGQVTNSATKTTTMSPFRCTNVTGRVFLLHLDTGKVEMGALKPAPTARTRHSAVYDPYHRQLWLIGGLDLNGNVLKTVDVLDLQKKTWRQPPYVLPHESWAVSNAAAFMGKDKFIYVMGGYKNDGTASSNVFAIDPYQTMVQQNRQTLVTQPKNGLHVARGGMSAVTVMGPDGNQYAVTVGGFSQSEDHGCTPLRTVERYNVTNNSWDRVADLPRGRGDTALVAIQDTKVLALGGVTGTECASKPNQLTLPTNDVLVLDFEDSKPAWNFVTTIPTGLFRFAAVQYRDSLIYTLGGQRRYDAACGCYRATNEVAVYRYMEVESQDKQISSGSKFGIVVASIAGALVLLACIGWNVRRCRRKVTRTNEDTVAVMTGSACVEADKEEEEQLKENSLEDPVIT